MAKQFGFIIFVLVSILSLAFFWSSSQPTLSTKEISTTPAPKTIVTEPTVAFIDPQWGADSSSIVIVEFADFTCPFCREAEMILEKLLQKNSQIKIVWKNFPNDLHHRLSSFLARAGECAQTINKFKTFQDWAFRQTDQLSEDLVKSYLKIIGLTEPDICLNDERTEARVLRTVNEGLALGLDGTPTLFINGKMYQGDITEEALAQEIKNLSK